MKKVLTGIALAAASTFAQAEYKDVIGFEMTGDCSFSEYMEVVADFNKWAEPHGYNAQVFMPMNTDDLETFFWVGTSANAGAFGTAHDMWLKGIADGSEPAKLMERFAECSNNTSRSSYYAY